MKSRSQELRDRDRRVFAWSIGLAVVAHVAVFALSPTFRAEPVFSPAEATSRPTVPDRGEPLFVRISFGSPEILDADGHLVREDRQLRAEHVLQLPPECVEVGRAELPMHGRVRLRVSPSGRAEVVELAAGTGNDCGDVVVTAVAGALHYEWLPDERFPAPVELVQPVSLLESRE